MMLAAECATIAPALLLAYGLIGMLLSFLMGRHGRDGEAPVGVAAWLPSSYSKRGKVWLGFLIGWAVLAPFLLLTGLWMWDRLCP